MQEEKDKKETELLELQKSVNETKSTVGRISYGVVAPFCVFITKLSKTKKNMIIHVECKQRLGQNLKKRKRRRAIYLRTMKNLGWSTSNKLLMLVL